MVLAGITNSATRHTSPEKNVSATHLSVPTNTMLNLFCVARRSHCCRA